MNYKLILGALISIIYVSCQVNESIDKDLGTQATESTTQQQGAQLFLQYCASCHNPMKDETGPALKGLIHRVPDKQWIYSFIKNSAKVISEGDPYANELWLKWNKVAMPHFPNLSNREIDAIMDHCGAYE